MNGPPLKIFLGWDPREQAAYEVADFSIRRRSSMPVLIHPLILANLSHVMARPIERRDGKLWCPISQAPMATEFAISRFCVPLIQTEGWALFADSDILCLADLAELFTLADDRFAVQVVKHKQESGPALKMDGQVQTFYARKNWSSVILWNCSHPAHNRLTHARLNGWPGRDLHAFAWLEDKEIGELPPTWNHLVGVSERTDEKLLHYTLGGPWLDGWTGGPRDNLWITESRALRRQRPLAGTAQCSCG